MNNEIDDEIDNEIDEPFDNIVIGHVRNIEYPFDFQMFIHLINICICSSICSFIYFHYPNKNIIHEAAINKLSLDIEMYTNNNYTF
jgi:hypothetical protein